MPILDGRTWLKNPLSRCLFLSLRIRITNLKITTTTKEINEVENTRKTLDILTDGAVIKVNDTKYLEKERIYMFAKQFKDKLLGLFEELHELGRATEEDVLLFEEKSKKYSIEYLESFLGLLGKHAASSAPYYPRFVDGTLYDYLIEEGYTEEVANDFLIFMESYHGSREKDIDLSKK